MDRDRSTLSFVAESGRLDERRIHRRLRCEGVAEVHFFPSSTKCNGVISDMSRGGCCIKVDEPVEKPSGTPVEVHLRVKGIALQVTGSLRYVRQQSWVGIQFSGISGPKASQIYDLIEELELSEKAPTED